MKYLQYIVILSFLIPVNLFSQQDTTYIKQMVWGPDYQVYLKMSNDSNYNLQIEELFHANVGEIFSRHTEFVYYPVNFDRSYIEELVSRYSNTDEDVTIHVPVREPIIRKLTLWGALGKTLDGSWVHFVNCLLYSLETRQLELTAPLLKRPESNWKPNPMTDTYKRTKKWKYYAPVEQKYAIKEFKYRKKNNKLGDLQGIPQSYINLFLSTSEKQYQMLLRTKNYKQLAKIDLVKLMLGTSYMGEPQIEYIKSRVLQAISKYNACRMPTVLIFDEYQAAVAMSLNEAGYKAEKIVFKNENELSYEEILQRTNILKGIIALINEANKKAFKDKLGEYYK
jgi:hypothetical protein